MKERPFMTHTELEKKLIQQLHKLPIEAAQEVLDFARGLGQKTTERPLGLLRGKASLHIADDFAITDEELLGS